MTSATCDPQFTRTRLNDGFRLVKLNKDTGSIGIEIVLRDKKTEY